MQEARRRKHLELVSGGTNFTRAAEAEDNRQPAPAPRGTGRPARRPACGPRRSLGSMRPGGPFVKLIDESEDAA